MTLHPRLVALAALLFLASPIGCGRERAPRAQQIAIEVRPSAAQILVGNRFAFDAEVTGTADRAVSWDVLEPGGGTVDSRGLYTAPMVAGVYHVRATSRADGTKTGIATATVTSGAPPTVSVSVSPATGAVHACRTLPFAASVTGAADNSVTWSVQEGAAGGTVDAAGVYTAPDAAGTYHVVATSNADPSRSAIAPVDVTDLVVAVALSPAATTAAAGITARFTATVTTTCGTFAAVPPN